jgi:catechol 2,3-dioxygenase-like lactoylglutathione lyase family enzyme
MTMRLGEFALIVPDYDEAIEFFTRVMGFTLLEDTPLGGEKRWVRVAPPGSNGGALLIARAATPEQRTFIGNQFGGRVGLFLHTDNFEREHARLLAAGITFTESPRREAYGTVAVFTDRWGNKWDLLQLDRP